MIKKRIRICVAIDRNGKWQAHGSSDAENDSEMRSNTFVDHLEDGEQYCFVEADIPMHTEPTILGKVKLVKEDVAHFKNAVSLFEYSHSWMAHRIN